MDAKVKVISEERLAELATRAYVLVRRDAGLPPSSDGPAIAVVLQRLIEQEEG